MKIHNAFRLGLFGGLGVLVAVLIGGGVAALATILTYVGAALFLALGVDPAVSFLERHGFKRSLAILTVLVGILAVFAGLILAIVPVIVDQVNNLIESAPRLFESIDQAGARGMVERDPAVAAVRRGHEERPGLARRQHLGDHRRGAAERVRDLLAASSAPSSC